MIVSQIINVDIIDDILIRPEALNCYLGQEVSEYLIEKLKGITTATLINVNLRKADPIDYSFMRPAFGGFYRQISDVDHLDAVFYLNKSQIRSLYWGILESQDQILNGVGDYETEFKINNSIKLSTLNHEIRFISNLTSVESAILNFINEKRTILDRDLYQHFTDQNISYDDITDSLRSLKAKKFLYAEELASQKQFISIEHKRDSL